MMHEMISVIMPVYNSEKHLAQAIDSVLNQTYPSVELIIVNDASTDRSNEIIQSYADRYEQIRCLRCETNVGVANARNRGIAAADGEYIALLDSDDIWLPNKLTCQLALLKKEQASLAYCSYDFIDENGVSVGKPFIVPFSTDFRHMLTKSVISCSTVLGCAHLFQRNPFPTDHYHEDYALWMKLLQDDVKAVGCSEVLARYRQHIGSRSHNKLHAAKERIHIFRKDLHLPLYLCVYATFGYALNAIKKYYF